MINNMLEIHVDSFKMCINRKRPKPYPADSTGMWAYFMAVQSTVAVCTNLALVCFTSSMLTDYSMVSKLFIFIGFEHVLLMAKKLVQEIVPDTPEEVNFLCQRQAHLTNKLFRGLVMEVSERSEPAGVRVQECGSTQASERCVPYAFTFTCA